MAFRRDCTPGGTYFFTLVTRHRAPFLATAVMRDALRQAIAEVRAARPFVVLAWVVLPDHMHFLWRLPPGDADHSRRWGEIKRRAGGKVRNAHGIEPFRSGSALRRRESGLWQRRYWEHRIRDEGDLHRHVDYVHFNPVKHGLVSRVADWPHSSFHAFVARGVLPLEWGGVAEVPGSFGE
jgi:putative transposase